MKSEQIRRDNDEFFYCLKCVLIDRLFEITGNLKLVNKQLNSFVKKTIEIVDMFGWGYTESQKIFLRHV